MALPPSIHKQFLLSLCISLPLILLLVWAATCMENAMSEHPTSAANVLNIPPITGKPNKGDDKEHVPFSKETDLPSEVIYDNSPTYDHHTSISPEASLVESKQDANPILQEEDPPPLDDSPQQPQERHTLQAEYILDDKTALGQEEDISSPQAEADSLSGKALSSQKEDSASSHPKDVPPSDDLIRKETAPSSASIPAERDAPPSLPQPENFQNEDTHSPSEDGESASLPIKAEDQEKLDEPAHAEDDPLVEQDEPPSDTSKPVPTHNDKGPSVSLFTDVLQMEECSNISRPMMDALDRGSFSYARHLALKSQNKHPECESKLSKLYTQHADAFLATKDSLATITRMAAQEKVRPTARIDALDCWNPLADGLQVADASRIVLEKWDLCCSQLESVKKPRDSQTIREECFQDDNRLCCGLFEGSPSYLRLPALQEVKLQLRLDIDSTDGITLEQDGFLRKFDPAGVLWPTGYMLSICLADPDLCGIPEVLEAADAAASDLIAIELGAGVGAPSLVLTRLLQQHWIIEQEPRVLATDRALHALALAAANGQAMGSPMLVQLLEDHSNFADLERLGQGYSIVLGSSLQSLFDWQTRDPRHTLWKVLDKLLDPTNPNSIAILAHVTGAVQSPNEEGALFELVRTISGNELDMRTRSGDDSDFAISVYRRKVSPQGGGEL